MTSMPTSTDPAAVPRPSAILEAAAAPRRTVRRVHGLAFKLGLFLLTSTGLIFIGAFAYFYQSSKDMLLAVGERYETEIAAAKAADAKYR